MRQRQGKPKMDDIPICVHCGHEVHPGVDGGRVSIPWWISGEPTRDEILHNACFSDRVYALECKRQPVDGGTTLRRIP